MLCEGLEFGNMHQAKKSLRRCLPLSAQQLTNNHAFRLRIIKSWCKVLLISCVDGSANKGTPARCSAGVHSFMRSREQMHATTKRVAVEHFASERLRICVPTKSERSGISTETGKRSSAVPVTLALITAGTSMFCVAKPAGMNTVQTVRTYGCDSAQHVTEGPPVLHPDVSQPAALRRAVCMLHSRARCPVSVSVDQQPPLLKAPLPQPPLHRAGVRSPPAPVRQRWRDARKSRSTARR